MSDLQTTALPRSVSVPPHPADGLTLNVTVGENAHLTIPDPRSFDNGGPEWIMRYGNAQSIADTRFTIASLLSSYTYLLDPAVSMQDVVRKLRFMRQDFKEAAKNGR